VKRVVLKSVLLAVVAGGTVPGTAQQVDWASPRLQQPKLDAFGPYDAEFIAGGDTISKRAQGYASCLAGSRSPASAGPGTTLRDRWI